MKRYLFQIQSYCNFSTIQQNRPWVRHQMSCQIG